MKKKARIVIGAGYGDEGKGLITDYLCHKHAPQLVVRFNGGAQAGHTVVTPDGKRHVFSHFGSGSLLRVPTYLSSYFVVNPIVFVREMDKLKKFGQVPRVFVDEMCYVTTPYDIIINQLLEKKRSNDRHGSVGVGFGETIERCTGFHRLQFRDLIQSVRFVIKMDMIRNTWFPKRAMELGLDMDEVRKWQHDDRIIENFTRDCVQTKNHCFLAHNHFLDDFDDVVMEGAQGLMLDQDYGPFPHVTRSNTGMLNAASLCMQSGFNDVETTYVTRAYVTRHGAGPLSKELDNRPYRNVRDETNLPHDFQGFLRFAYLDVDVLKKAINFDIDSTCLSIQPRLAITCLDQVDDPHGHLIVNGGKSSYCKGELGHIINNFVGLPGRALFSNGPTRADISEA